MTPARMPAFGEVEPDVRTALLGARKAEAREETHEKMRAKDDLVLPMPPERAADATPRAATQTP